MYSYPKKVKILFLCIDLITTKSLSSGQQYSSVQSINCADARFVSVKIEANFIFSLFSLIFKIFYYGQYNSLLYNSSITHWARIWLAACSLGRRYFLVHRLPFIIDPLFCFWTWITIIEPRGIISEPFFLLWKICCVRFCNYCI